MRCNDALLRRRCAGIAKSQSYFGENLIETRDLSSATIRYGARTLLQVHEDLSRLHSPNNEASLVLHVNFSSGLIDTDDVPPEGRSHNTDPVMG